MSGKRQAGSDLNHLNWDKEEEPEDVGSFQLASEEELKTRVIKKARRKLPETCDTDASDGTGGGGATQTKSVFSGFSGFAKAPISTSATSGAFSFLSKIPAVASNATSTTNTTMSNVIAPTSETTENKKSNSIDSTVTEKKTSLIGKNYEFEKSSTYYAKLKGLNHAVTNWIKMHVDKNPLCILTPIFKDYENYLNEIEKDERETENAPTSSLNNPSKSGLDFSRFKFSATPASMAPASSSTSAAPTFSFGIGGILTKPAVSEACTTSGIKAEPSKSNGFSFGINTDDKPSGSGNQSIFNLNNASSTTATSDDKPSSTVFSFSNNKPFTFANVAPPPAAADNSSAVAANADENDEEDQPPKVEFKAVVEEDAVYSKRCKLFMKIDGKFSDRGVGMLYLKPVKETNKTQLLMRADTNIGNILVNLILNESIPTQRMGKNNVMLVCIPMPEAEKATSILFRVKTSVEADELFETIEKYKKQ